ncbi:hypothetical protein Z517_09281 [Fonsecaea pedrosoi CBS 271.37]|uniref:Cytochrome P450 n=1 Tax=Fonsecaea pedrosoi CBS 271.37 TaxID=1442368 RepID=A0A0D2ERF5_9EURO|nr:uncharacterized protein Z517_09281 [Fonsecaea pedrosoi CBS 271.37]KIW76837.1 hypothetical protein Z517_09281 [Fonsecaea pedrosoi CBS 271.37]
MGEVALPTRSNLARISKSTDAALSQQLEEWNLALCDKVEDLVTGDGISGLQPEKAADPVMHAQIRAGLQQSCDVGPRSDRTTTDIRLAIASEMFDYNLSAHGTTGITITSLLFELSRNPNIQEKLRQQLWIFVPPEVTPLSPPDLGNLDGCSSLNAFVLATLRVWPLWLDNLDPRADVFAVYDGLWCKVPTSVTVELRNVRQGHSLLRDLGQVLLHLQHPDLGELSATVGIYGIAKHLHARRTVSPLITQHLLYCEHAADPEAGGKSLAGVLDKTPEFPTTGRPSSPSVETTTAVRFVYPIPPTRFTRLLTATHSQASVSSV